MRREIVELTCKLIRIDSSNPPGREKDVAIFIKDYLSSLGVSSTFYSFAKDRPNVVCEIPSLKRKKKILLTPHIDTVPIKEKNAILPSVKVTKRRIYGRGATDDKGNVAVALMLIKIIREEKITFKNLDLVFAFTADEETGSRFGIIPLLKHLKGIDYGIVLDSDDFQVITSQKGLLHLRIEIFGKEAHGAYPERGINAIEKSVYILKDIINLKFCKPHPVLGKTTVNIGKIEGGDKVNIVAGYSYFELDIRYPPYIDDKKILQIVRNIIEKYKVKFRIKILASQGPIEISKKHFLLEVLKKVLKDNRIEVVYRPSFGATVINFLKDRGIECFAFGFGSKGCAHTEGEYVEIDNLVKGVKVLKEYLICLDKYLEKV